MLSPTLKCPLKPALSSASLLAKSSTALLASASAGQQYQLSYIKEFDEVRLVLDHHEHASRSAGPLVLTSE